MRIININSLIVTEIEPYKISEFINTHYIYTGIDIEQHTISGEGMNIEITYQYPPKYRKQCIINGELSVTEIGATYTLPNCVELQMMNETERAEVDLRELIEKTNREFNHKRFKITIDSYNYASEKLPALLNYVSGKIQTMLPQYGELQPDGDQSVTLFVTEIHPVHRAAMEQHTAVIHITENPYYIA